jgi:hypothetical protein
MKEPNFFMVYLEGQSTPAYKHNHIESAPKFELVKMFNRSTSFAILYSTC